MPSNPWLLKVKTLEDIIGSSNEFFCATQGNGTFEMTENGCFDSDQNQMKSLGSVIRLLCDIDVLFPVEANTVGADVRRFDVNLLSHQ